MIKGNALFLLWLISACVGPEASRQKINGIGFVAPVAEITERNLDPLNVVHAGWVCIMPYAYCKGGRPEIVRNLEWQWWGEKEEGVIKCLELLKKRQKKVMLKPQLWVSHGEYTGDFTLLSEDDWKIWENQYMAYILEYAKIAQSWNVELFCIGTELKSVVKNRPDFWNLLIEKVKEVYSGELTYAANWDNYENIPFWKSLDYVGIDAYFPLSGKNNPTEAELINAWERHKSQIMNFSARQDKPILFTEIGYRSINYTSDHPWDSNRDESANNETQKRAYSAMFKVFWPEDQFAGLFIWKWFDYHHELNGEGYLKGYTPQKKPAEAVIRKWFSSGKAAIPR